MTKYKELPPSFRLATALKLLDEAMIYLPDGSEQKATIQKARDEVAGQCGAQWQLDLINYNKN